MNIDIRTLRDNEVEAWWHADVSAFGGHVDAKWLTPRKHERQGDFRTLGTWLMQARMPILTWA